MILECPLCSTRYLVQIGLFAQGGRRVRCARCKHEWHEKLPTTVDVVAPIPEFFSSSETGAALSALSSPPQSPNLPNFGNQFTANLPAVIEKVRFPKKEWLFIIFALLAAFLALASFVAWRFIATAFPGSRVIYEAVGLSDHPEWAGLIFENAKSELKYDSGTMRLLIDGTIYNASGEKKTIPDIRARALGPDKAVIQSWWVEAPAATIEPGAKIPFHTESASPMEHTIEDVRLEFILRKDKENDP
jgi:predicted Zn finger-like uncharacterized protein